MGEIMNKLFASAAALLFSTAIAAPAHADTLTFDDLTSGCYGSGEGCPMLPNMAFDGTNLTYTSGSYILSFAGGSAAHISDGFNAPGTYNWHDGPDNLVGSVLTLARVDGLAFDLTSFDYASDGLLVAAAGFTPLTLSGEDTVSPFFTNVTAVNFSSPGFRTRLDNIVVNAVVAGVPEPTSWAMMIGGFGMAGGALRRRKANVSVRYA